MVHLRLNERESNPNPHVNFISSLPARDAASQEDARQFLRALAAQVRPIMKSHGLVVNSLEEYEYNMVFAGRNWNAGEVVEIVLRRPDGSFAPTSWLMSTLCHELAHIKHMNHGPAFQALWKRLREEVRALQDKGYHGDGYWSSGTRLLDSAKVTGDGIEDGEFPEYMCGGAHSRTRPTGLRRRRGPRPPRPGEPIASLKTGRQTAKKRKAGTRVASKYAFAGEGALLVEDLAVKDKGTGFRKQAGSKRAREERALAAERRIQALQSQTASTSQVADSSSEEEDELESEDELVGETDAERRKTLLHSTASEELPTITSWRDFEDDFDFTRQPAKSPKEIIDIPSDDDIFIASGSTFTMPPPKIKSNDRDNSQDPKTKDRKSSGLGNMVQSEMALRKKESLGMAPVKGGGRVLKGSARPIPQESEWACSMCTLLNRGSFLVCSACAAERSAHSEDHT